MLIIVTEEHSHDGNTRTQDVFTNRSVPVITSSKTESELIRYDALRVHMRTWVVHRLWPAIKIKIISCQTRRAENEKKAKHRWLPRIMRLVAYPTCKVWWSHSASQEVIAQPREKVCFAVVINRRSQTATKINASRNAHLCQHNSRHYSSKENVFQHHFVTYSLTRRIDLPHPGSPTTKGCFPLRSQRLPTTGFYHWHVPSLPGKLWVGILIGFLPSSKCDTSLNSRDKVSNVSTQGSRD